MSALRKLKPIHCLDILVYLLEHGETLYTTLMRSIEGSAPTKHKALEQLVKLGLVKERRLPPRRYLVLTEKGIDVAERLKGIDEVLRSLR